MNRIEDIEREQMRTDMPYLQAGDKVRVHVKILEGGKERIQVFEGIVIRVQKGNNRSTITVRKVSYGVGVERIFPLHSPMIDHIDLVSHGKVRQGRLYYLRKLRGKAARIKVR
jgi:large subunit ribosomal protein L19